MTKTIVVSFSGGKDSTATALLALDEAAADVRLVFADTGNEHALTLEYIHEYIPRALGRTVEVVRGDFTQQIAGKRAYIASHWAAKGVPEAHIAAALAILQPTGVPFLDMCLWKGRFPSRMAQFCTQTLKRWPMDAYMVARLREGRPLESWQGVRRDESRARINALDREWSPDGWELVRPIAAWTAAEVIAFVQARGLELNPLYKLGMGRVGCMPCINVQKNELAEIARRFPEHVDKIREWERLVGEASKRGCSSFFTDGLLEGETDAEVFERLAIDQRVKWAMTTRGGKQLSLLKVGEPDECASSYGLCE